jgi:hypothetical protein
MPPVSPSVIEYGDVSVASKGNATFNFQFQHSYIHNLPYTVLQCTRYRHPELLATHGANQHSDDAKCLIPTVFAYGSTHLKFLWLHRTEMSQQYS